MPFQPVGPYRRNSSPQCHEHQHSNCLVKRGYIVRRQYVPAFVRIVVCTSCQLPVLSRTGPLRYEPRKLCPQWMNTGRKGEGQSREEHANGLGAKQLLGLISFIALLLHGRAWIPSGCHGLCWLNTLEHHVAINRTIRKTQCILQPETQEQEQIGTKS